MEDEVKILVQCDFDGTVTEGDVSFLVLDVFASGNWRQLFKDYEKGKATIRQINEDAFSTIKADKKSLLDVVRRRATVRPGFRELVDICHRKGYRFVIVSNGLRFYIDDILGRFGITDIEVYAAETEFCLEGLKVHYIGPDGSYLDNDFKVAYANSFLNQGYRIIYMGNGSSDLEPAKKSQYIFAIDTLLKRCQEAKLDCIPFTDLNQVANIIEAFE